jgi:hypothetical protein
MELTMNTSTADTTIGSHNAASEIMGALRQRWDVDVRREASPSDLN